MQNKLAVDLANDREMILYCDLHGHSRRKNVFIYGNTNNQIQEEVKLFPFIMSKICPDFWYKYSKFKVQRHKQSTARIAMWKNLPTDNVFTLEASFCGPNIGPRKDTHFRIEDYQSIGHKLCQAILIYAKIEWPSLKVYLEAKAEEEDKELENQEEANEAEYINKDITVPNKSINQQSCLKQSNIKFQHHYELKSERNMFGRPTASNKNPANILTHSIASDYESYDKITHSNIIVTKQKKPFLKVRSGKVTEPSQSLARLEGIPRSSNVLKSLDTNNLLHEFRLHNMNESEADNSASSDSGETTSGSESNFDDKELAKVLPKFQKGKNTKPKKSKSRKHFSIRSQRRNNLFQQF